MDLEKIKNKLSDIFDLADKKQNETQEKLAKIIGKLEQKKTKLKEELMLEGESDNTSEAYDELEKEYKVVNKLLKKAKKNYLQEQEQQEQVDDS